jgi:general secretion pathway protein J
MSMRASANKSATLRRLPRGFTLVELLVAVAVLAIVAVLGWRGLDGIIRSRQALTEQMDQTRGLQLAFAQLQSDLEQLAPRAQLRQREQLLADATHLTMVRTVFAEGEPSRVQVVSYRIREGVLLRQESIGTRDLVQLDTLWQAALNDMAQEQGVPLQSGVASLEARVWQNGAWQPVAAQSGAQPSSLPDPLGLELSLRLVAPVQAADAANAADSLVKVFLLGEK